MKKYWISFMKGNRSFVRKRPALIFSILFFLVVATAYVWGIKLNDHLSDKEYVKHEIETNDPVQQIIAISKMVTNEEFDIDRDFLTKRIRVIPHSQFEPVSAPIFTDVGPVIGFTEGDSALYVFSNGWEKVPIPIKFVQQVEAYNHNPFLYNFKILYDHAALKLFYNESAIALWAYGNPQPFTLTFDSEKIHELAGTDGTRDVYFLGDALARVSDDMDSIYMLPLHSAGEKYISKDSIVGIRLPKGTIDYKSRTDGLVFHALDKGKHSLFFLNSRGKGLEPFVPDSVLNRLVIGDKVDWEIADDGTRAFFNEANNSISLAWEGSTGWKTKIYKRSKLEYFTQLPDLFDRVNNIVWLAGKTSRGYGVAKIIINGSTDSLAISNLEDYDEENETTPVINVNNDGLVISSVTAEQAFEYLRLYRYSTSGNKLEFFDLHSFLDTALFNALRSFDTNIPKKSNSFEFTATSAMSIGSSYLIIPQSAKEKQVIYPVQDNSASSPRAITWPSRNLFDVESIPDYFFTVILLIGVILLYFFGLFYVMDFKNRDKPYDPVKLPILDVLPTLREKLDYAKNTMSSLKLRSEIMLWLGIVIGVSGMVAFVLSLKAFFQDTHFTSYSPDFTVRLLRTFGIFSFMEVFCFYFLKQYRITYNEYKRFYSLYLRLLNYYQYIEMMIKFPDAVASPAGYKDLRDAMLKDSVNMHDESNLDKINEFEKSVASDIVKTLADKIPTPKTTG